MERPELPHSSLSPQNGMLSHSYPILYSLSISLCQYPTHPPPLPDIECASVTTWSTSTNLRDLPWLISKGSAITTSVTIKPRDTTEVGTWSMLMKGTIEINRGLPCDRQFPCFAERETYIARERGREIEREIERERWRHSVLQRFRQF